MTLFLLKRRLEEKEEDCLELLLFLPLRISQGMLLPK
jgi:hypothetical protein